MPNKVCCNPFKLPNHSWIEKNVAKSSASLKEKHPGLGEYICLSCKMLLSKGKEPSENSFVSIDSNDNINNIALSEVSETASSLGSVSGRSDIEFVEGDVGIEMMNLIKLKVKSASNFKEKIHWLTVTPLSWNLSTLKREFNLNYSTAKYAKKIQNLYGFGSYPPAPSTRRTFSSENIEKIINFYTSDEISRVMPGQKDCLSVQQEDGKKIKLQKRLILCNLKEAYVAFKSLYPEIKVGFSKFASLRPKQCVLADSNGTHTVCVCKIHQNFKLMLNGLKSIFEDISVTTYEEIIECMICSKPKNECYMKQCDLCPGFHEIATEIEEALKKRNINNITYQLWTNTDRSSLETITEEAKIFLKKMSKEADILLLHNFVAKEQSNFLKNLKTNLKEGELIVIGDFSENFTFLIQNAIQSHHWNNSQTTIHPFVIYRPERDHNNSLKFESFVLISESTEHSTEAVYLFQSRLISFIKENYGSDKIKKIYYFSDGAASQYKNRKNFINFVYHFQDFNIEAEWHFFATSHGKNACDGIGGTIKRYVRRESLRRPDTVPIATPGAFFNIVKNKFDSITFDFCSNEALEDIKKFLSKRFLTCKTISGTRGFHSFIPVENEKIKCKKISNFNDSLSSVFNIS